MCSKALIFAFIFSLLIGIGQVSAQDAMVNPNFDGHPFPVSDTGAACTGGIQRDDGTIENAYQQFVDSTGWVHKMRPPAYPFNFRTMCVEWMRTSGGASNITYDLVVYDTTGPGGGPGVLKYIKTGVQAANISTTPQFYRYDTLLISILNSGSYYFGVRFDNNPVNNVFICVDEDGPVNGFGYYRNTNVYPPQWISLPDGTFPNWRNFGIRAEGFVPPACPFPTTLSDCFITPYTAVTGTPGPSGDDVTITVPIGFSFCFNGVIYTQASICTNGFVVLGSTTFNDFTVNLCGTNPLQHPMLAPFWADLNTLNGGNIVYTTLGTAPNRIFVVQYTNVAYFSGAGNVTMQVRLYENGNYFYFQYGPAVSGTSPGAVGLSKSPGGSGNVISITPGATCAATTFSTTTCNNSVTYTITNFPEGRRYCFSFYCVVGIEPTSSEIPHEYTLSQNYPNPFNPATKISYALPKAGNVKLVVFDLLGREVAVLVNEFKKAGSYDVEFDGSNLSSGVYLYRIESGDFTDTKKMLFIK